MVNCSCNVVNKTLMYCLINEQECFIRFKVKSAQRRSASGFRPNKTRPASLLNGLKNSLIIHEENTKKNHKRVVSVYVIQIHVDLHKL